MLSTSMDMIQYCASDFPRFQEAVQLFAEELEYPLTISGKDIILGKQNTARYVIAARCAAPSGVAVLLAILRSMPENQRSKVCFVILGRGNKRWSSSWRNARKRLCDHQPQLVLNLDSISSGDHLRMIPGKELKEDRKRLTSLYRVCGYFGRKDLLVHEKGISWDCSENSGFPYSARIVAAKPVKTGIRKWKADKNVGNIDITNVNILRAALTTLICCDEVN